MALSRGTGLLVCCCIAVLAAGMTVGVAAGSGTGTATAATPSAADDADEAEQPATACYDTGGAAFTIGSSDETHIWLQFHAATVTDSGGAVGVEMIGATETASIVELVVGADHVGDGVVGTLSSPADSFDAVTGFDFQLPMLEDAQEDLENAFDPDDDSDDTDGEVDEGEDESESESDGSASEGDTDDDSRYELLEC